MSNQINHITITIHFDVWNPMQGPVNKEIDELLGMIRGKKLLAHVGNFHSSIKETKGPGNEA